MPNATSDALIKAEAAENAEAKAAADKVVAAAMKAIGETMDKEQKEDEEDSTADGTNNDIKAHKRKERLEQNRISARESRKRKKTMIEELQRTVITLSRENKDLNERNETLRTQLMEIGTKYPNVVSLQAIIGGSAAPGGVGGDPLQINAAQQQQQQQQQQAQQQQQQMAAMAFWQQQQQQLAAAAAAASGATAAPAPAQS